MVANEDAWLTQVRRGSEQPDELGLRAGDHVRAIEQRIRSLRIVKAVLKWAVMPGWAGVSVLLLRRTFQLGAQSSLPGLGVVACLLGAGGILLLHARRLRREIEELEVERFELLEWSPV